MLTKRIALLSAVAATIFALAATTPSRVHAGEPLRVVATFSILGDMVQRVGGRHVRVTTLVGPNGDAHVYQPTPTDARAVSEARLLVINGLEFEGWLERLVGASDFRGTLVVASSGVEPLPSEAQTHEEDDHGEQARHQAGRKQEDEHAHDAERMHTDEGESGGDPADGDGAASHGHGALDSHAWQSLDNARIYVSNIAAALTATDAANATDYDANRDAYVAEIDNLDAEIRNLVDSLPEDRRTVVTSHDAFAYFGESYGLTFLSPQGVSTESDASAKDIARLIELINDLGVPAVFVENISDPRLLHVISDETGAAIGGTLYSGALSGPAGPAPTFLDMMRHNAITIISALKPPPR